MILKSDQEPAIRAVMDGVARWRVGVQTLFEQSPVKSSSSNGVVERAIRTVEQQLRTMKSAWERRWGVVIPDAHRVLTWMTEYVAFVLNRFEVCKDGKTAYERLTGKKATVNGLEFGEGILFKDKPPGGGFGQVIEHLERGGCSEASGP